MFVVTIIPVEKIMIIVSDWCKQALARFYYDDELAMLVAMMM